jgi:hypothetical protein
MAASMPASAPHGFHFFTPPSQTTYSVSEEKDLGPMLEHITAQSMINRAEVDETWISIAAAPDFAALYEGKKAAEDLAALCAELRDLVRALDARVSHLEKDQAQDKALIVQLTTSLRADEQLQQSTRDEMSVLSANFERVSSDVTRVQDNQAQLLERIQVLAGEETAMQERLEQDEKKLSAITCEGGVKAFWQPKRPQTPAQPKKRRATVAASIDLAEHPSLPALPDEAPADDDAQDETGPPALPAVPAVPNVPKAEEPEPEPEPTLPPPLPPRRDAEPAPAPVSPPTRPRSPPMPHHHPTVESSSEDDEPPTIQSEPSEPSEHVLTAGQQARMLKAGWVSKAGSRALLVGPTKWQRRWLVLHGPSLRYAREERGEPVGEIPLLQATVKLSANPDREHFEVDSPHQEPDGTTHWRTYLLHAPSKKDCAEWRESISLAIQEKSKVDGTTATSTSPSAESVENDGSQGRTPESPGSPPADLYSNASDELKEVVEADWIVKLRKVKGNDTCADCIGAHMPTWASGNLGVLLCSHCVGAHRKLGTHISQPLSLHLDDWSEDLRYNMFHQGNKKSNEHYEANHVYAKYKPSFDGDIEHTVAYVTAKYEKRSFTPDGDGEMPVWESTTENAEIVEAQVHAGVLIVKVLRAHSLPSAHYHISHASGEKEARYAKVKLDGTKMKTKVRAPATTSNEDSHGISVGWFQGIISFAKLLVADCRVSLATSSSDRWSDLCGSAELFSSGGRGHSRTDLGREPPAEYQSLRRPYSPRNRRPYFAL